MIFEKGKAIPLVEMFEEKDSSSGQVLVRSEEPIEVDYVMKGGYLQYFQMEEEDGRQIKKLLAEELLDIEGYFFTQDARASERFANPEIPHEFEFPFHGHKERDLICIKRTKSRQAFKFESMCQSCLSSS